MRMRFMPDMPAIAETVPGFSCDGWYGIAGPRGMPAAVVKRLNTEMNLALANAEFVRQLEAQGLEPGGGTPQHMRDFVRNEIARWSQVVKASGIQPPQ